MFAFDAVVLAGGRSSRLGGSPKALLRSGSGPGSEILLDRAISAAAGAETLIVVAPDGLPVPARAVVCREDPPFAGPLAGLDAGVRAAERRSPWVLALACDIPGSAAAVAALLAAARDPDLLDAADALLAHPEGDRPQPLVALYRAAALLAEFDRRPPADRSMWSVLDRLRWHGVAAPAGSCADVDTPADAAALGWHLERQES
ncbi:MAG: NTP transferase domain-containing protein [Microbacteriaceae bacterium]|nr:NTP transferase domain-containing protein [Microbacteriaceae bacterium]MCL2794478.1 NTP transferase domain-containing protein [Microbacteriaceae bacterium]